MRAQLVGIIVLVAFAGCVNTPPAPDVGEAFTRIAMEDCVQTHTFASFPPEAFAGMLPEGWSVQTADPAGRTTQFYLAGSQCEHGSVFDARGVVGIGSYAEVFGYLFVTPPNGSSADFSGDLWPIGGVVSHPDARLMYEAWGFEAIVVEGMIEVRLETMQSPLMTSRTVAVTDVETFDVNAAVLIERAEFHDGAFRIWIPAADGEQPTRSISYAWPGGEELGIGAGDMRYEGPLLNAPPEYAVVVHHVRDVVVTVEPVLE